MATASKKRGWNWFMNAEDNTGDSRRQLFPHAITPWQGSVPSLSQMQRDMERMFTNGFRDLWSLRLPSVNSMPSLFQPAMLFQPNVNIASNDNEYTITVEAPGMEEKDIRLDVSTDGVLTISGEKRQEMEDISKNYECVECSYGAFQRILSLPEDIDQEAIEARFKNGVLTILCPRMESARLKARQIPIEGREGYQGRERSHGRESQEGNKRTQEGSHREQNIGPKKAA